MTDQARTGTAPEQRIGPRAALASAEAGDWLEVDAIPGADPRRGEIVEVLGAGPHLHFRVRWDDGHESLLYPAPEGGVIVHHSARAGRRRR